MAWNYLLFVLGVIKQQSAFNSRVQQLSSCSTVALLIAQQNLRQLFEMLRTSSQYPLTAAKMHHPLTILIFPGAGRFAGKLELSLIAGVIVDVFKHGSLFHIPRSVLVLISLLRTC